jgi:hypothetical protein
LAHLHFTLSFKEYITPETFQVEYRNNERQRKKINKCLWSFHQVPRSATGYLMPRGSFGSPEWLKTAEAVRAYMKLEPFNDDMASHYYGKVGIRLRDWRTYQVPTDAEVYQEQATVFMIMQKVMKQYE